METAKGAYTKGHLVARSFVKTLPFVTNRKLGVQEIRTSRADVARELAPRSRALFHPQDWVNAQSKGRVGRNVLSQPLWTGRYN